VRLRPLAGAATAGAALLAHAAPAAAHSGQPTPEGLYWAIWFDPKLAVVLAIPTLWVATAVFGLRRRLGGPEAVPKRTLILYPLAIALYYLGSATSLDEIGERYLFTFHMAQHSLFVYVVAPLLVLSLPEWVLRPALANRLLRPVTYLMTRPIVAYVTFHALFAFWHIPGFYEWALRDRRIHDLEHASFILSGCLMWWPLLGQMQHTAPRIPTPGVKLLYILFLEVAQMPMTHVARALEVDESRGLMKAVVDAETKQLLGAAVLGIEGGEVMSVLQTAMMGEVPVTRLKEAPYAHPTLAESLNNLFAGIEG